MRTAFFFSVFLFSFSSPAITQSFIVQPDNILLVEAPENIYNEGYIYMVPTTNDTLHLQWRLVGNTLPDEWEYALCDYGQCYTGVPNTGQMAPLPPTENAYLKMILNPYEHPGHGVISFRVYESHQPDSFVTVHFEYNTELTATSSPYTTSLQVFPNPVSQLLTIDYNNAYFNGITDIAAQSFIQLVNENQQVVLYQPIRQLPITIDLSDFSGGLYLLQINTAGQIRFKEKIIIIK